MTSQITMHEKDCFDVDWGDAIKIPDGEYEAVYVSHHVTNGSFGSKVKIIFRIVTLGEYYEKVIHGWYNIHSGGTNKRKGGRVTLTRGQKLTTELLKILQIKKRPDRLSPSMLKGHLLLIKVRTTLTNCYQKKLSELQQYSVVDSMLCSLNYVESTETLYLEPKPVPEPIPTKNSPDSYSIRVSGSSMSSS